MAYRCDIPVYGVSILPEVVNGWPITGRTMTPETYAITSKKLAHGWALYCFAGKAACLVADVPDDGYHHDFNIAAGTLEKWDKDDPDAFEQWKSRAVEIMREPHNVMAVRKLAEALLQRGRVGPDVVASCCAPQS
jgi:hypothetical protein